MNIILFDNTKQLLPLSYTRPISHFRIGISTIKEKWELYFDDVSVQTEEYLSHKFPLNFSEQNLWINSSIIPNDNLVTEILSLRIGEVLQKNDEIIAIHNAQRTTKNLNTINTKIHFDQVKNLWDIFQINFFQIEKDFNIITQGRVSEPLSETNRVIGDNHIFIEKGARVECSVLNTTEGSIYIGKNAEIMEGSLVRGPFAICENSLLKMGSKIYGGTTLGPFCKVGGEVNNSVLFGYSSKSHDGFLGNSVLGEWCNLGADTNTSNLKNNYANVKLWSYPNQRFENTGLQFCGLIMGDHSKSGINTMFNTGTVVGVGSNIFGSGFVRNFVPSFSWGGSSGFKTYHIDKMIEVASSVMSRRDVECSEKDKHILEAVFNLTSQYRNY